MTPRLKPHPIPDPALDADIAILGKKGRGKTFDFDTLKWPTSILKNGPPLQTGASC